MNYCIVVARSTKGNVYAFVDLGFKKVFVDLTMAVCLMGISYDELNYIEKEKEIRKVISVK